MLPNVGVGTGQFACYHLLLGVILCYDLLRGMGEWAKKDVFQRYLICERPLEGLLL